MEICVRWSALFIASGSRTDVLVSDYSFKGKASPGQKVPAWRRHPVKPKCVVAPQPCVVYSRSVLGLDCRRKGKRETHNSHGVPLPHFPSPYWSDGWMTAISSGTNLRCPTGASNWFSLNDSDLPDEDSRLSHPCFPALHTYRDGSLHHNLCLSGDCQAIR